MYYSRKINPKKSILRHFFLSAFCLLYFVMPSAAQSSDYIQGWRMIGESETFLDVSSCVINCDGEIQIYISLFNEYGEEQTANFNIKIIDPNTGNVTIVNYTDVALDNGEMKSPNCEEDDFPECKLDVPNGYDPETLQVEVEFL